MALHAGPSGAAARVVRRFPQILDLLSEGALTLTSVCLLAPVLTPDTACDVLNQARYKSRREVEVLLATLRPRPPVPSSVRRLPQAKRAGRSELEVTPPPPSSSCVKAPFVSSLASTPPVAPPRRTAVLVPLAPEQYKVQCTVSRETYEKLRRAQDLLRHAIPSGDPAAILDRALTLLVADLEKKKLAATTTPRGARDARADSRHVPAAVKREVWARDGGRCAFEGTSGRCRERGFLEFHHIVPYARGGPTAASNLELRCRAHNAYEAEREFGPLIVRERGVAYGSVSGAGTRVGPSASQSRPIGG